MWQSIYHLGSNFKEIQVIFITEAFVLDFGCSSLSMQIHKSSPLRPLLFTHYLPFTIWEDPTRASSTYDLTHLAPNIHRNTSTLFPPNNHCICSTRTVDRYDDCPLQIPRFCIFWHKLSHMWSKGSGHLPIICIIWIYHLKLSNSVFGFMIPWKNESRHESNHPRSNFKPPVFYQYFCIF